MITLGQKIILNGISFAVAEQVASGGYGFLYRADCELGPILPPVAVKVPRAEVLADETWRRKFYREARILGNIEHPNVVKIVAFLEDNQGHPVLIQEFLQGARQLAEVGYGADGELLSIALQALYGLRATHGSTNDQEYRSIHRDISPSNILVLPDGVVKIVDFGLARETPRLSSPLTSQGEGFGTMGCVAPEQQRDAASADHRADLYSLGRTLASVMQCRDPLGLSHNKRCNGHYGASDS